MPPASKRSAYVAWAAVCLLWGTTYLAIRVAIETIPPLIMAGFRWSVAGSIILAVLKIRGERIPPPSHWLAITVLGVLLIGFGNGCVVWAEQTLPSGLTAVLVAAIPFWMVGVERFMKASDPITTRRLIGLVVGFSGIVLLVWPELALGNGRSFSGRRVDAAGLSGMGDRFELFATPARRRKRPGGGGVADAVWRSDSRSAASSAASWPCSRSATGRSPRSST